MPRTFRTVDHEAALDLTVRLGDCLPPTHLARFIVDTIAQLDLAALYARYGVRGGPADAQLLPAALDMAAEIALRQDRLARLAEAKTVLEERAAARFAAEQAEYQAKQAERAAQEARTGREPGGRPPTPPTPGPREGD